jgi:O-antigen/teichoic acid export membrane protein
MTSIMKKGAVGLIDQGMSSLSNVVAVVMVAQSLSASAFGSFTVSYAILIFVVTLTRSYFGTQLGLTETGLAAREQARAILGALLLLTPLLAITVGVLGVLLADSAPWIVLIVAVAAPLVCLQDVLRYVAVAVERAWVALASDTVWVAIAAVPALGLVQVDGPRVLGIWLGAAAVAFAVAIILLRIKPSFAQGRRLLRKRHAVGSSLTIGAVAVSGASVVVTVATAHFLGPASAGSLRGASTVMGPLNVVQAFVTLNMTPILRRRERAGDIRFCVRVAVLISVAVATWSTIVLLLPDAAGGFVLGESWAGARSVLPWMCFEYLFLGLATPTTLWLRVRFAARKLLQNRLAYAALLGVCGSAAAVLGPSAGYVAAGLAAAAAFSAGLGWLVVLRNRSLNLTPPDAAVSTR